MPVMDGIQFSKELRSKLFFDAPIVCVSGSPSLEDIAACKLAGISEVLTKPVSTRDLQLRSFFGIGVFPESQQTWMVFFFLLLYWGVLCGCRYAIMRHVLQFKSCTRCHFLCQPERRLSVYNNMYIIFTFRRNSECVPGQRSSLPTVSVSGNSQSHGRHHGPHPQIEISHSYLSITSGVFHLTWA